MIFPVPTPILSNHLTCLSGGLKQPTDLPDPMELRQQLGLVSKPCPHAEAWTPTLSFFWKEWMHLGVDPEVMQWHGHTPILDHTAGAAAGDSFWAPKSGKNYPPPWTWHPLPSPLCPAEYHFPSLLHFCFPQLTWGRGNFQSCSCPTWDGLSWGQQGKSHRLHYIRRRVVLCSKRVESFMCRASCSVIVMAEGRVLGLLFLSLGHA